MRDFLWHIAKFTLAVEAVGFVLLAVQLVPALGWRQGLWVAAFHAVSAFNNAGFALYPEGAMRWQLQPGILLTIAALVIVGGLGYIVNREWVSRYVLRRTGQAQWGTLMHLVLSLSALLLGLGTLGLWLIEHNNPATLGAMAPVDQWVNAFFMAVQPRSGGFNSLDVSLMERPAQLLTIVLMFIGGGPGGTAGGIKLTTMAVATAAVFAAVRGDDDVNLPPLRRRINEQVVRKAFAVVTVSLIAMVVVTLMVASLERFSFLPILFEVTSAFSTVGLSMGITATLSDPSKLILVVTMVAGRVGMLAILLALFPVRRKSAIRYSEEPLLVG